MENGHKRVGIALSGGVVRGFAHIGALRVLEEAGIPVHAVAGTSVGAIMGAIYATGMRLSYVEEMATDMQWLRVAAPTLSGEGLFSFDRLEAWLEELFGHLYFEDLAIPFAAVATDMETGEPVMLRSGPLAPAVRASCSVPGVVTPRRLNGRLLCDGGISNNLPVTAVRQLGADYVIGVDVFRHAPRWPRLGPLGRGLTAVEIMVEHAGGGLNEADCLIAPDLSGKTYVRFGRRDELKQLGQHATQACLRQICQDLHL